MQIVIAWVEQDFEVISTAGVDIGKSPKIRRFMKGKACMWLNQGTEKDVASAEKHVKLERTDKNLMQVFTFKSSKDPLTTAKRQIERLAEKALQSI